MKLLLGGHRRSHFPHFVCADQHPGQGVEIVHDFEKTPWPFAENCAQEIAVAGLLERLPDKVAALNELWRISRPGARIRLVYPAGMAAAPESWLDPHASLGGLALACVSVNPEHRIYLKLGRSQGFRGAFHLRPPSKVGTDEAMELRAAKSVPGLVVTPRVALADILRKVETSGFYGPGKLRFAVLHDPDVWHTVLQHLPLMYGRAFETLGHEVVYINTNAGFIRRLIHEARPDIVFAYNSTLLGIPRNPSGRVQEYFPTIVQSGDSFLFEKKDSGCILPRRGGPYDAYPVSLLPEARYRFEYTWASDQAVLHHCYFGGLDHPLIYLNHGYDHTVVDPIVRKAAARKSRSHPISYVGNPFQEDQRLALLHRLATTFKRSQLALFCEQSILDESRALIRAHSEEEIEKVISHRRQRRVRWEQAIEIYARSRITLNLGTGQSANGFSNRVFDAMAAGALVVSEFSRDLEMFTLGEDLVCFESDEELIDTLKHYLAHPSEARDIARQGQQTVRTYHTFTHRAKVMIDQICSRLGW